jgi:hypothetical protein
LVQQADKYAAFSDATLQHLRHLRDAVLQKARTPEQAVREALKKRDGLPQPTAEDPAAFNKFVEDMCSEPPAF